MGPARQSEIDGPDVLVEQGHSRQTWRHRAFQLPHTHVENDGSCRTAPTRHEAEGERLLVMLINPYPDFAVLDVDMVADVGRDSIESLVVPAGAVVAVDVTREITVADSVSVFIGVGVWACSRLLDSTRGRPYRRTRSACGGRCAATGTAVGDPDLFCRHRPTGLDRYHQPVTGSSC